MRMHGTPLEPQPAAEPAADVCMRMRAKGGVIPYYYCP